VRRPSRLVAVPDRTAAPSDPVAGQVETTLFRALAVLRSVVAVYVVALNASRWHELAHPVLGWAVVAGIAVWTGLSAWAYDAPARRGLPLLIADLLVAVLALLSTPYVQSDAMLARNASTMPSFWVMVPVLAWAVGRGWTGGVAAALVTSVADLSVRVHPNGTTWGNIFLLLVAAGVVGYSTDLLRQATQARADAERAAAVLAERVRLARAVHDGVLQVLALVQRRGGELGGEAADLGRLAGQQEAALRALVQGDAAGASPTDRAGDGTRDLVELLRDLSSRSVTVSVPPGTLRLPGRVADELVSAVRACLDNVDRHVGADAPAWVLLEEHAGTVMVSVRDEGPGIAADRLQRAELEGRLGVSSSIRGRMADLGGAAHLETAPGQGTEWELVLPLR
jgi:signal transduction histidine kinase